MIKSLLLFKAPPFVPFFRRKAQTAAAIFH
ncbi:MAG: hypothetical protein KEFWMYNX_002312, partial [Candidatus Fervidibacter sp.]